MDRYNNRKLQANQKEDEEDDDEFAKQKKSDEDAIILDYYIWVKKYFEHYTVLK